MPPCNGPGFGIVQLRRRFSAFRCGTRAHCSPALRAVLQPGAGRSRATRSNS
jgi:hypothetical protein